MQCHRCPKSVQNGGTPDEECLTCKGADILDNDHVTVSPTDDISKLMKYAEPTTANHKDNSLESYLGDDSAEMTRNIDDCLNVVNVLKTCHHTSLPHIAKIVAVLVAAGTGLSMAVSMLNGETLAEYARSSGTSRQAAQQKWNRIVKHSPKLAAVPKRGVANSGKRRRKNSPTNGGGGKALPKQPIIANGGVSSRKRKPKNG